MTRSAQIRKVEFDLIEQIDDKFVKAVLRRKMETLKKQTKSESIPNDNFLQMLG